MRILDLKCSNQEGSQRQQTYAQNDEAVTCEPNTLPRKFASKPFSTVAHNLFVLFLEIVACFFKGAILLGNWYEDIMICQLASPGCNSFK